MKVYVVVAEDRDGSALGDFVFGVYVSSEAAERAAEDARTKDAAEDDGIWAVYDYVVREHEVRS